ncbi:hypothetical protein Tco_0946346, partial [Tanacetum coccineum]
LAKDGLARGIPRLKFQKDHLCSACALGNSKKSSHQPKAEDTNQEKLYLLHMDLCGPIRVSSINGKSSGPRLQCMTPATSSSGLVPNPVSQQPCILANAPRAVDRVDSPVSTSIDQNAPSTSIPSTQEKEHSPNISQGVEESPKHHIFMMIHFMNLFMKTRLLKDRHLCDYPILHLNLLVDRLRIIQ